MTCSDHNNAFYKFGNTTFSIILYIACRTLSISVHKGETGVHLTRFL